MPDIFKENLSTNTTNETNKDLNALILLNNYSDLSKINFLKMEAEFIKFRWTNNVNDILVENWKLERKDFVDHSCNLSMYLLWLESRWEFIKAVWDDPDLLYKFLVSTWKFVYWVDSHSLYKRQGVEYPKGSKTLYTSYTPHLIAKGDLISRQRILEIALTQKQDDFYLFTNPTKPSLSEVVAFIIIELKFLAEKLESNNIKFENPKDRLIMSMIFQRMGWNDKALTQLKNEYKSLKQKPNTAYDFANQVEENSQIKKYYREIVR